MNGVTHRPKEPVLGELGYTQRRLFTAARVGQIIEYEEDSK